MKGSQRRRLTLQCTHPACHFCSEHAWTQLLPEDSEKAWLQCRRVRARIAAAAAERRTHEEVAHAAAAAGKRTWSAALDAFEAGLQKKRRAAKVAAFSSGQLLEGEIDAGLPAEAEAYAATVARNDAAYETKRAFVQLCLRRGPRMSFRHQEVHFEASVAVTQDIRDILTENSMRHCSGEDRLLAKFFVVNNVAEPGQRTSWASALVGGYLMDPTCFTSMGATGVCLAFSRALSSARQVWMSQGFQEAHTSIAGILKQAVRLQGSSWRLVDDVPRNKSGMRCLGLVTLAEKRAEDCHPRPPPHPRTHAAAVCCPTQT